MPINWPKKKEPEPKQEEQSEPKPPRWRDRATKVIVDMEHTRGVNHDDRRAAMRDQKERIETISTSTGTRSYTSQPTKPPMSRRRARRRMENKRAREARKMNR